jgi:hypothetical protein
MPQGNCVGAVQNVPREYSAAERDGARQRSGGNEFILPTLNRVRVFWSLHDAFVTLDRAGRRSRHLSRP